MPRTTTTRCTGRTLTPFEVLKLATDAFDAWGAIRTHDAAQDFLLDLFLPKRTR